MKQIARALLVTVLMATLLLGAAATRAAGMEDFGSAPLNGANYERWPGVMPTVNHPSRVYHWWVNGNEKFFYEGDTAALNDILRRFAEIGTERRVVVLRPGPGETKSFDQSKTVRFHWSLHLLGGIAGHLATLPQGEKVWSKHPVLSVFVDDAMDLDRLEVPKGVTLVPLAELKQANREALKSANQTVRGWGAGVLAELDHRDPDSLKAITALLQDPYDWVKLNAAGVLPLFGEPARSALPALRELRDAKDENLRRRVQQSIDRIEQARPDPAADRDYRQTLDRVERFIRNRKE
jgi:hypothetical protein